jgi:hypothetical protein
MFSAEAEFSPPINMENSALNDFFLSSSVAASTLGANILGELERNPQPSWYVTVNHRCYSDMGFESTLIFQGISFKKLCNLFQAA